ncbi:hypothetical protein AURDEDRAFT_127639 [Auricularia subglabra TFB-10046 SS5]|nr:hypothetical protein AURDEDRAFT_127639 [Auricularia subglabra TFB-10046 SS5]
MAFWDVGVDVALTRELAETAGDAAHAERGAEGAEEYGEGDAKEGVVAEDGEDGGHDAGAGAGLGARSGKSRRNEPGFVLRENSLSSAAYDVLYITHHSSFDEARDSETIVESTKVAGGASGKSGGLVATWARPRTLAELSCAEHKRLADLHAGAERRGFRRVSCGQWDGSVRQKAARDGNASGVEIAAQPDAARITLPAGTVIVAAGPWVVNLLPALPLAFSLGHSIVIRPSAPVPAHCVFTSIPGYAASPKIFPRSNGKVYLVRGADTSGILALSTAEVPVSKAKCDALKEIASNFISPALASGEVIARQACYRPELRHGAGPIVGELPGNSGKGLLVAVRHSCWGICNAPGTAKALRHQAP